MSIKILEGHSPEKCFALQWFKGYEQGPLGTAQYHSTWTLDGGRPYPHFECGAQLVIWADRPGIRDKSTVPRAVQSSHIQNLSFITCICGMRDGRVVPTPEQCFEWQVDFAVDVPNCALSEFAYAVPTPTGFYPEPCKL